MNIGTTMAKKYGVSPYAKGTTLNKLANMVVDKMRYSGKKYEGELE